MDSTSSSILADTYINEYQKRHLDEVNIPNKIEKYVDDILFITKVNEHVLNNYVNELNKIPGTVKFTSEFE
ncbi:unnamed protein product [Rotaria sp. Silwood1]|nr:unnamed protein product [Rotaria sp. Silwood1]